MDPKVKLALEAIALGLQGTDPLAYGNIVAFLAGQEGLKADTLVKLLPILREKGFSLADMRNPGVKLPTLPLTTGATQPPNQPPTSGALNDPLAGGRSTIGSKPLSQPVTGGSSTIGNDGGTALRDPLRGGSARMGAPAVGAPGTLPLDPGMPGGPPRPTQGALSQTPSNVPAATPPGGPGSTLPGGFTASQGSILGEDDNQLVRFALQAAGLNPDRMGRFGQIVAKMLAPMVAARRNAFGIADGSNVGGLPQDIAAFAKEFTTGGVDAFGNAANYGRQALASPNFTNAVNALSSPDQQIAMYQSLLPLLLGGANPLMQQAAADTSQRTAGAYNDATFNASGASPNGGIFSAWLNSQPNLDPIQRSIFGIQR